MEKEIVSKQVKYISGLKVSFKKLFAILKIMRPSNVFITGLTIFVSVLIFGRNDPNILKLAFIAGIVGSLIDAGGNIINDFFDVEIDKINKPNRPIPSGLIKRETALSLYFLTTISGLGLGLLLNKLSLSIALLSAVIIFLYSFKLKRIPLFGNFTVALMTGFAFIFAGSVVDNFKDVIFPFLFALLINFSREIVKDIEDIEGDLKAGIKTFPILAGVGASVKVSIAVLVILIFLTLIPYFVGIYNQIFLLLISVVDIGLIYVIISLLKDTRKSNLNKLSNLLKFEMLIGLFAIYFGSLK